MTNLFVTDRLDPTKVGFPKGFEKLDWTHVTNHTEYHKLLAKETVGAVVLDSSCYTPRLDAISAAKALTEATCEKHTKLPPLLVIGQNEVVKSAVTKHLAQAKRWIDLNRGK